MIRSFTIFKYGILQGVDKVSAEIAKAKAETEFEKYLSFYAL